MFPVSSKGNKYLPLHMSLISIIHNLLQYSLGKHLQYSSWSIINIAENNFQNIVKQSLQCSHKWIVQKIKNIESKANRYIPNSTTHI